MSQDLSVFIGLVGSDSAPRSKILPTTIKNAVEARQGGSGKRMPVVLGLSILLVITGFAAVYGYSFLFLTHS